MPSAVRAVLLRRNLTFLAGLAVIGALTVGSSLLTEFSFSAGVASVPKAFSWMARNFIPNARALRALPNIGIKLAETVLVAIMATVLAAGAGLVLAILASRTTRPHPAASAVVRLIASVCRNVPVVAWAMIFLLSFGQNVLTGLLSLFIGTPREPRGCRPSLRRYSLPSCPRSRAGCCTCWRRTSGRRPWSAS
jgi:phosphonate transport system permease protein